MNVKIMKRIVLVGLCMVGVAAPIALMAAEAPKKPSRKRKADEHEDVQAAKAAKTMTAEELALAKTLEEMRTKEAHAKAGYVYASKKLGKDIMDYVLKRQVPEDLGAKLDVLFDDAETQAAFAVFDKYPSNQEALARVRDKGFILLGGKHSVFTHKDFPEYVFKISNINALGGNALNSNVGRIWYGDYLRDGLVRLGFNIRVPQKWIHFMTKECSCESLNVIVVAQALDTRVMKLITELPIDPESLKSVFDRIVKELYYPDAIGCNMFYGNSEYVIGDTESSNLKFSKIYPKRKKAVQEAASSLVGSGSGSASAAAPREEHKKKA